MLSQFLFYMLVGFIAQIVDGSIGMAFGLISSGVLIGFGLPPMVASASVHTAEIFTTGISGFSHAMFKNIDYTLFRRLALPGILGSIIGAFLLTKIPDYLSKPFIAVYLITMGGFILYRAFQQEKLVQFFKGAFTASNRSHKLPHDEAIGLLPLGFAGGLLDATGGGGWGPIVNSTLLAQGTMPRFTIGSVNLAEFLVTLSSSATFFLTIGISYWFIILGLIIGGSIAAPFAAYIVRYLQPRIIMFLAGIVVTLLGLRIIWSMSGRALVQNFLIWAAT